MKLCPACSRHLRRDATSCPFCGATLTGPSRSLAALSLAAGLAMAGCGDDGKEPTTSASSSSTSESTGMTTTTTTDPTDPTNSQGVSAYGGPPVDTMTAGDRALPAPDADAPLSPPEPQR